MDYLDVLYVIAGFCLVFALISAYLIYIYVQEERKVAAKMKLKKEFEMLDPSNYAQIEANHRSNTDKGEDKKKKKKKKDGKTDDWATEEGLGSGPAMVVVRTADGRLVTALDETGPKGLGGDREALAPEEWNGEAGGDWDEPVARQSGEGEGRVIIRRARPVGAGVIGGMAGAAVIRQAGRGRGRGRGRIRGYPAALGNNNGIRGPPQPGITDNDGPGGYPYGPRNYRPPGQYPQEMTGEESTGSVPGVRQNRTNVPVPLPLPLAAGTVKGYPQGAKSNGAPAGYGHGAKSNGGPAGYAPGVQTTEAGGNGGSTDYGPDVKAVGAGVSVAMVGIGAAAIANKKSKKSKKKEKKSKKQPEEFTAPQDDLYNDDVYGDEPPPISAAHPAAIMIAKPGDVNAAPAQNTKRNQAKGQEEGRNRSRSPTVWDEHDGNVPVFVGPPLSAPIPAVEEKMADSEEDSGKRRPKKEKKIAKLLIPVESAPDFEDFRDVPKAPAPPPPPPARYNIPTPVVNDDRDRIKMHFMANGGKPQARVTMSGMEF